MGTSNVKAGLENRIALYKGELEPLEAKINMIEDGLKVLNLLKNRRQKLRALISGAEDIIFEADPEWQNKVKPRRKRKWHSPFQPGDLGLKALNVLRVKERWMRPREVALIMLKNRGLDPDRDTVDKVANSVGGYFKKHEGDLVESRGSYAKEWRIIERYEDAASE